MVASWAAFLASNVERVSLRPRSVTRLHTKAVRGGHHCVAPGLANPMGGAQALEIKAREDLAKKSLLEDIASPAFSMLAGYCAGTQELVFQSQRRPTSAKPQTSCRVDTSSRQSFHPLLIAGSTPHALGGGTHVKESMSTRTQIHCRSATPSTGHLHKVRNLAKIERLKHTPKHAAE